MPVKKRLKDSFSTNCPRVVPRRFPVVQPVRIGLIAEDSRAVV
jgi:hypothetical protein